MSGKSPSQKSPSGKSPSPTTRAADPRPARSRAALAAALFELIQEKRWERITVQDLLDRTGLGRSTFYAHFDNKFDLLTAAIPNVMLPLTSASEPVPDLQPLFDHVQEIQPVLRPLLTQPLLGEVMNTFQNQLADAWSDHLKRHGFGDQSQMLSMVLAGGFMAVARDWLNDRCAQPSVEVCTQFTRLAHRMING